MQPYPTPPQRTDVRQKSKFTAPRINPVAQPTQMRTGGTAAAAVPGGISAPTREATHPAQSQAAQPTQMRTGGEAAAAVPGRSIAPAQDKGQAPTPNPSGAANPNAHRRQSRRSNTRQVKRSHARLRALMSASGRTNPTQRESQGPNNPHPAAASRASGSNCGRRCSRTYTV